MRKQFLYFAVLLVILLAGCSPEMAEKDSEGMNETGPDENTVKNPEEKEPYKEQESMYAEVEIYDSGFRPEEITISKGGTVRWVNRGSDDHTVQSDMFPQESGKDKKYSGRLAPGESWEKTFNVEGFYNYFDLYDDELKGKVIVE